MLKPLIADGRLDFEIVFKSSVERKKYEAVPKSLAGKSRKQKFHRYLFFRFNHIKQKHRRTEDRKKECPYHPRDLVLDFIIGQNDNP